MKSKRKICVVTAARSEFGPLKLLMDILKISEDCELQVIVTGGHLEVNQGLTFQEILDSGFHIDHKIDMQLEQSTMTQAMGLCLSGMGDAIRKLQPDIMVVLGDRYELLPICSAALVSKVPIAHISGGDLTEGALDDSIRHAVTKMSSLHFPGLASSAKRILQLGEERNHIFSVGEPGIDRLLSSVTISKAKLSKIFALPESMEWCLTTYHSETQLALEQNIQRVNAITAFFSSKPDTYFIVTAANSDEGGKDINLIFEQTSNKFGNVLYVSSLGEKYYPSMLKEVDFLLGSSSSGIIEAATFKTPVINIGDRQKGREQSTNIFNCSGDNLQSIEEAYCRMTKIAQEQGFELTATIYGDGNASQKIADFLVTVNLDGLLKKKFSDIEF